MYGVQKKRQGSNLRRSKAIGVVRKRDRRVIVKNRNPPPSPLKTPINPGIAMNPSPTTFQRHMLLLSGFL